MMLCWISSIVAQYALLLNVGELAGDMFLNFGFTMLMELPAFVFIYTMADRLGEISTFSPNLSHNMTSKFLSLTERFNWSLTEFSKPSEIAFFSSYYRVVHQVVHYVLLT